MDLLDLTAIKSYLLHKNQVFHAPKDSDVIQRCGRISIIDLNTICQTNLELEHYRTIKDCIVDAPYIWYTKIYYSVIKSIQLPCDLNHIHLITQISKPHLTHHFKDKYIWNNMIFDLDIVEFISQNAYFASNIHNIGKEFNLSTKQLEQLKGIMERNVTIENIKESLFKEELCHSTVAIESLKDCLPKNELHILSQNHYSKLDTVYMKEDMAIKLIDSLKLDLKESFYYSNQEIPLKDFKVLLKMNKVDFIENNNIFYNPKVYYDCIVLSKYCKSILNSDANDLFIKCDFPLVLHEKKCYLSQLHYLQTYSYYYLKELMALEALKEYDSKFIQLLFNGIKSDFLLPLLDHPGILNYDALSSLVHKDTPAINLNDLWDLVKQFDVAMSLEEFKTFNKASLYFQYNKHISDITRFHIYISWIFIQQHLSIYIKSTHIPDIVQFLDPKLSHSCTHLMETGTLDAINEYSINYVFRLT